MNLVNIEKQKKRLKVMNAISAGIVVLVVLATSYLKIKAEDFKRTIIENLNNNPKYATIVYPKQKVAVVYDTPVEANEISDEIVPEKNEETKDLFQIEERSKPEDFIIEVFQYIESESSDNNFSDIPYCSDEAVNHFNTMYGEWNNFKLQDIYLIDGDLNNIESNEIKIDFAVVFTGIWKNYSHEGEAVGIHQATINYNSEDNTWHITSIENASDKHAGDFDISDVIYSQTGKTIGVK